MEQKYNEMAEQILELVGGKDNIKKFTHCVTRLRFDVKDKSIVDLEALKKVKGVMGAVWYGEQCQVIVGSAVDEIYSTACQIAGIKEEALVDEVLDKDLVKNEKPLDVVFTTMQKIMFPIFGVLAGSGMINALFAILANTGLVDKAAPTYVFFTTVSNCATYALPVLVGYTAAKAMDTDVFIGMLLGLIMEYPSMTSLIAQEGGASLFGITIKNFSYSGTVIPIILAVLLEKYLVGFLNKHVPKVVRYFVVPMVALLVIVPAVYLVLGPVGATIGSWFGQFFLGLMNSIGTVAMGLMCPALIFLVAAGMHMAISPFFRALRAEIGFDPLFSPAFLIFNLGIAGSALAYAVTTKDEEKKGLGVSAFISGLCGISEPALYGTVLVDKKNLLASLAAFAIAGAVGGLLQLRNYNFIPNNIFGLFGYGFEGTNNLTAAIISSCLGFALCFVFNYIVYKRSESK